MLDKRYQVYILSSGKELQRERMVVSQTLIGMDYFAWGLEQRTPLSSNFARRQIDDCDYVVLLLGRQYGEQSVSGVSYMHLEYIYAVTKQKPIMVMIANHPESTASELQDQDQEQDLKNRLHEFINQIKKEVETVIYYNSLRELELALRLYMPQMLKKFPAVGWVRPQRIQILQDQLEQLNNELVEVKTGQAKADTVHALAQINIKDHFSFDYRVHAYQDGSFKELSVIAEMRWLELLHILSHGFSEGKPEENFAKIINHYLNENALADAQKQMPRTHAISRAQINIHSLNMIKQNIRENEWIVPIGRDDRQRLLWSVTAKLQTILKNEI